VGGGSTSLCVCRCVLLREKQYIVHPFQYTKRDNIAALHIHDKNHSKTSLWLLHYSAIDYQTLYFFTSRFLLSLTSSFLHGLSNNKAPLFIFLFPKRLLFFHYMSIPTFHLTSCSILIPVLLMESVFFLFPYSKHSLGNQLFRFVGH
jgi:hypothetical protein